MRINRFARIATLCIALAATPGVSLAQVPPVPPTPETPRTPRTPRPPRPPSDHGERGRFEETDRKTLTLSNATELDLSNISGDIVVVAGGGRDAKIECARHGYGDTPEEARRQLAMLDVNLTTGGDGRGQVWARYSSGRERSRNVRSSVDYHVTAPPHVRIHVKSMSGDVEVSRIKGDLTLESVSGNIRVEAGGRLSLAKTVSGDVEISGVAADEPLVVSSMSGTVTMRSIKARYVDINSVSGDLIVKDVDCERAELQTLSGNIEYAGRLLKNGRYEMKAHSGDIRLALAGDIGFEVEANSFSGKIRSDLPIKNEVQQQDEEEVYAGGGRVRLPKRATLRGTYRNGSATIELTTFSGDIVITK